MNRLASRSYAGEADLQPMVQLLRDCRAVETIDRWPSIYELRQHLRAQPRTAMADTRLWEDQDHHLLAFASIWDNSTLVSCIHPGVEQSEEVMAQMLAWGGIRVQELSRQFGERPTICVPVHEADAHTITLLKRQGFAPGEWYQLRMSRSLAEPLPTPQPPRGFMLRQGLDEADLDAYMALHRDIFLAAQKTADDHLARRRNPAYRPDLDLIAVTPDGTFAAFCLASISLEENGRAYDRKEGWIDIIGARPAYRRRGLGRALLLVALQNLKAYGVEHVLLSTGSWNDEAQNLFRSTGFRVCYKVRWYFREVEDWGGGS